MTSNVCGSVRRASALGLLLMALGMAVACSGSGGSGRAAKTPRSETVAKYDSLAIQVLRRMGDGKEVETARVERRLSEVPGLVVSFVSRQVAGGEDAVRTYQQRLEIGSEKLDLPQQAFGCESSAKCLSREWLHFELRGSAAPRVVERTLYERSPEDDEPVPSYRRYTITVLTQTVTRTEVQRDIQRLLAAPRLAESKSKVEAMAAADAERPEALSQLDALDVGGSFGHVLSLAFAAESDALTERLASSMGVVVRREVPRVLITSVVSQGNEGGGSLSLDLRLDEVRAESADPAVLRLFQLARGIEESALEARLLDHMAGEGTGVSTARLMLEAHRQGIELAVITRAERQQIASLGAPPPFASLLTAAVDKGHHVVVPSSAVDLAGRQRWGFWDVQPQTGITIGVMEGGEHQGMTDYMQTTRRVALDPRKAFLIGLHAGMIQSQFAYSALVLKYGEVTAQLIQELKDLLKDQACSACPQAGAGVELAFKLGDDCYKKALLEKKAELGFCDAYNNGFKCAVGMLIASLQGENQLPAKLEPEAKIQLGCGEAKLGGE